MMTIHLSNLLDKTYWPSPHLVGNEFQKNKKNKNYKS